MPEYPDIVLYKEALEERLLRKELQDFSLRSPFLLRTARPGLEEFRGRRLLSLRRLGKRLALGFEGDLWMVFHLMIAGRFHWRSPSPGKGDQRALLLLEFETGRLSLTEAGSHKRASLHLFDGEEGLREVDPGGLEPLEADPESFRRTLCEGNHTIKRALTDPRLLSGIGNAYSDEILHRAGISPVKLTRSLSPPEWDALFRATGEILREWTEELRRRWKGKFPGKISAFQEGMAVHGRFGRPCPVCGSTVQRIRYASRETNYCPRCQTGGILLADRSLSRLLKKDWPRRPEEWEELRRK